jgi:hypothetical protein
MFRPHGFRLFLITNLFNVDDGGIRNGGLLMGVGAALFAIALPVSVCFMLFALYLSPNDSG